MLLAAILRRRLLENFETTSEFLTSEGEWRAQRQRKVKMAGEVHRWLSAKETAAGEELAPMWSKLGDLHTRRLWHQMTILLESLVQRPELQSGTQLIELYENFIRDVEMRINALSLMEILVRVVKQYQVADQALEFLSKCEPKLKTNEVAVALCWIIKGDIAITKKQDVRATKESLETAENILNGIDGISAAHGRFYLLQSRLFKSTGETAEYYRSALKFLGCTKLTDLTIVEQRDHAKHLAVAALTSEGIYNFGELLAHPVLKSLTRTPDEWLIDLLKAFNAGDMDKFEALKKAGFHHDATLIKCQQVLHTKILLLCLMEMTFKRPATERQLTFKEIATTTRVKEDEVEILVMKALAKGLIEGTIDEVGKTVHMTWVQPRVLDRQQIGTMISRLDNWTKEISQVDQMMEEKAKDILLLSA